MLKKWIKIEIVLLFSFVFLMSGVVFAMTPEDIVTQSKPSIVRILIEVKPRDNELLQFYSRTAQRLREPIRVKAGTGFVINRDGYILTAYHVISPMGKSPTIYVRLPKEGDYLAEIVAEDRERQLACLKIKKNDLQPLSFAANPMSVGNEVYTMGFPLAAVTSEVTDQEASFTEGKVSAIKQTRQESEFIQTNAAINLGNAGGPLLNKDGQVGGVIIYSNDKSFVGRYFRHYGSFQELFGTDNHAVGIGFAAPAKYAVNMLSNANINMDAGPSSSSQPAAVQPQTTAPSGEPQTTMPFNPPQTTLPWYEQHQKLLWGGLIGLLILGLIAVIAIVLGKKKLLPESQPQRQSAPAMPSAPPMSSAEVGKSTSISFGALKCTNGELAGKVFPLTAKGLNIGRDADNDIRLTSETVSRKHCWIGPSGSGIVAKDLGSTNGIYINGVKAEGTGTKPFKPTDVLSLSKSGQEAFTLTE